MEFEKVAPTFIDVVKNLTSNEPATINEKKKPVYDARLNVRLLFVSNSILPYISDHSDGFWQQLPAGTVSRNCPRRKAGSESH